MCIPTEPIFSFLLPFLPDLFLRFTTSFIDVRGSDGKSISENFARKF